MKKKKITLKTFGILFLTVYFVIILVKQEVSYIRISKQINSGKEQLQSIKAKEEQLKAQLDLSKTNPEQYAEKQVRERLGYMKQNETPIVPNDGSK
ncbi:septum formation initiator family protein [Clostridium sp. 19966]|uniref:FtsB family cell division protein n=1 Tax=Clostridium sp. 19966 TaxID=2768166 RepID=UPI0028DF38CA|nr:septum formation initiator family protein [Clostridium sp. 19966]MDT8715749.1 septum formation initiator family protein [Clostridium sp. 19966]